ncbi:MAG: hypothetical protein HY023_04165, partial [Chloroflexi bacterium]|nr:hypothetical protein [Chloroflexota bacterium]
GKEGTPLAIMQGAGEAFAKAGSKPATQAELEAVVTANGGNVRPLEAATVMSRFPKKK